MSIAIGICNRVHSALADPACCTRLKGLGITAIQLDLRLAEAKYSLSSPDIRARWTEEVARAGLRLSGIAVSEVLHQAMTADPGTRPRADAEQAITLAIECAAAMGVPKVVIPSLAASAVRNADDLRHTARCLRLACALASSKGVLVATENNLAADEARSLLAVVGYANLCVMPDCSGPAALPRDLLARAGGEACAWAVPPETSGAFAGLKSEGFVGCIFLANSRQTEENGPALFAGIARDAGALRALWQTLPD